MLRSSETEDILRRLHVAFLATRRGSRFAAQEFALVATDAYERGVSIPTLRMDISLLGLSTENRMGVSEQDAFLSAIDGVLLRLYQASYDLGEYGDARDWCAEGAERFPNNYRFYRCQIYVMTMERGEPDVAEAWSLYDQMDELLPAGPQADLIRGITQTFLGGVVGQAGLPDSASAVMERARVDPDADVGGEQMSMEAAMRSVIGDTDGAIEALQRFMVRHPDHFPGEHWWWRNLQGDERFERLQTTR